MNERVVVLVSLLAACGTETRETVETLPSGLCEARFARSSSWCGGDPTGEWSFASMCDRNVLSELEASCPAGSFEMHPGIVWGTMTLTSTRMRANYNFPGGSPVTIDLLPACIEAPGVCPTWIADTQVDCAGDPKVGCHCEIEQRERFSYSGSPIEFDGNAITAPRFPDYRGEFCVEADYLYVSTLAADEPYYYILTR